MAAEKAIAMALSFFIASIAPPAVACIVLIVTAVAVADKSQHKDTLEGTNTYKWGTITSALARPE
jgi:hypothetical protein